MNNPINEILAIAIGILFLIAATYIGTTLYTRQQTKKLLRNQWGQPVNSEYMNLESIRRHYELSLKAYPEYNWIDDLTWNDLDMDNVFKQINGTVSSVGEEYLYTALHLPCFEEKYLEELEGLIVELDKREDLRYSLQLLLSQIGKEDFNGIVEVLYNDFPVLENETLYKILGMVLWIGGGLFLINQSIGILISLISIIINIVVYYNVSKKVMFQIRGLKNLGNVIAVAEKISKIKQESIESITSSVEVSRENLTKIKKINQSFAINEGGDLGIVTEYWSMILLKDLRRYNKAINKVSELKQELQQVFNMIGKVEMGLAIASYRQTLNYYTIPQLTKEGNELEVEGLYHPMIEEPVSNSVRFDKNVILTGSNASGKSSFIKALGINAILAQTIHTCLASQYTYKYCYPISSMAVKDNIINGESYFIAEIKSIKRILDKAEQDVACLCMIDEILKGTNTVERIAASTAILNHLKDKNCLCVIATHDRELPGLVSERYENYHFRESVGPDGVEFDYKIHKGVASTTNAIKLLEVLGYSETIIEEANLLTKSLMT